jgi:hypothetical protein
MVFRGGPSCAHAAGLFRAPATGVAIRRVAGTRILLATRRPPAQLPYRLTPLAPATARAPCRPGPG